jgi:DNA-binding CsgD family transcriptional regulator
VLKEAADSELVEAVRRAATGDTYLNPRLGAKVAAEPPAGPPDGLSEREIDVLRMIALGYTNAEIAAQLYLSVRTVETHRAHIQQKLRLYSRAELVRYALEHHLVETEWVSRAQASSRAGTPRCRASRACRSAAGSGAGPPREMIHRAGRHQAAALVQGHRRLARSIHIEAKERGALRRCGPKVMRGWR